MNMQSLDEAKQYVLDRLENELPAGMYYHGLGHTIADVVPAAEVFGEGEGIQGESLDLLVTAAWFHDIGFIEKREGHEAVSMRIAAQALLGFGYSAAQIQTVTGIIGATALPQSPTSILGQVLADADLDVLGRDDFMKRNEDLRRELAFFGQESTDVEWYSAQVRFVEGHTYFTATAHRLRDAGKAKNVADVKSMLAKLPKGK